MSTAATSAPAERGGWTRHSIWLLTLLTLITVFNYADRSILGVLQEPIKHEFRLSDGQLGMLNGVAFILLYAFVGLPIARLADVRSRKTILAVVVTLWSIACTACGLTVGFVQLAFARVLVGGAEAGATPIGLALIADAFPANMRGKATAIYSGAMPFGLLIAASIGGLVAHLWGWRAAFVTIGSPGILIGVLVFLTIRDPQRGQHDKVDTSVPAPNFIQTVRALMRKPTYIQVILSSAGAGFGVYAVNAFVASFYLREHALNLAQVGLLIGLGQGVSGFVGTLFGGLWMDRASANNNMRPYVMIPGISLVGAGVFFALAFNISNLPLSVAFMFAGYFCSGVKTAPQWTSTQTLADPRVRVVAAAVALTMITVVGQGLGPTLVGLLSDHLATGAFPKALGGYKAMCPGGQPIAAMAAHIGGACRSASGVGLKGALMLAAVVYVWSGAHSFWALRTVQKDMTEI